MRHASSLIRRGSAYIIFGFADDDDDVADVEHIAEVTNVGIVTRWSNGTVRATVRQTWETTEHEGELLSGSIETLTPGPAGTVLVTGDDRAWQVDFRTNDVSTIACGVQDRIPCARDSRCNIYVSTWDQLWHIDALGSSAQMLCALQSTAGDSIEIFYVTEDGRILLASSQGQVFQWSRSSNEQATADSLVCPGVTVVRADGCSGALLVEDGVVQGSSLAVTCLASDEKLSSVLVGCDNGTLYRWHFDRPYGGPTGSSPLGTFDAAVHQIVVSCTSDIWVVTHHKATEEDRFGNNAVDRHSLTGIVNGKTLSEPLWTGNCKVQQLACDEDGSLVAVIGDDSGPSRFMRWNRIRSERGKIEFHSVKLLDGSREGKEVEVKSSECGALTSIGRKWLAFVSNTDGVRVNAFNPKRPVSTFRNNDAQLVHFADGSTQDEQIAYSGNALLRIRPGAGREVLSELPSVTYDVDLREEPSVWESNIEQAARDKNGNVVFTTYTGHVHYRRATDGQLSTLRHASIRKLGWPDVPRERQIGFDSHGRVLDCHKDPGDRDCWRLFVWEPEDDQAREVFSYSCDYRSSESITAVAILSNGDFAFSTYFRRGETRKWRADRVSQPPAHSSVKIVRAGEWNSAELVHEFEWDSPWSRQWITSMTGWGSSRLLLGFENGQIAALHLPHSGDCSGSRLNWLKRHHTSGAVTHLKALNSVCFASASRTHLLVGTTDEELLEYRSDEVIRDIVLIEGDPPEFYLNEGTGTILRITGDTSPFAFHRQWQ